jgi:hypothetical protein
MSAQSTTTEFDGVAIYLPTTTPSALFENVPTDYAYDEIASRDNYDRLLCERIAAEFPGAVVTTSAHSAYHSHVEADDSELADRVYESLFGEGERAARIAESLYDDGGEVWMVSVGANTPDGLAIEMDNGTYLIWQADADRESVEGDVQAGQWLYQPLGYNGDLYSPAYDTRDEAISAARQDAFQRSAERSVE